MKISVRCTYQNNNLLLFIPECHKFQIGIKVNVQHEKISEITIADIILQNILELYCRDKTMKV